MKRTLRYHKWQDHNDYAHVYLVKFSHFHVATGRRDKDWWILLQYKISEVLCEYAHRLYQVVMAGCELCRLTSELTWRSCRQIAKTVHLVEHWLRTCRQDDRVCHRRCCVQLCRLSVVVQTWCTSRTVAGDLVGTRCTLTIVARSSTTSL